MRRLEDFNFASMGLRCFFHHTQAILQPNIPLCLAAMLSVSPPRQHEDCHGRGPARACAHDVKKESGASLGLASIARHASHLSSRGMPTLKIAQAAAPPDTDVRAFKPDGTDVCEQPCPLLSTACGLHIGLMTPCDVLFCCEIP